MITITTTVQGGKEVGVGVLWITTTAAVREGKGSRRGRLTKGQTPQFFGITISPKFTTVVYSICAVPILGLLPQYEEVKGVGVGVSQRDKRRDLQYRQKIWHYNIDLIYGAQ